MFDIKNFMSLYCKYDPSKCDKLISYECYEVIKLLNNSYDIKLFENIGVSSQRIPLYEYDEEKNKEVYIFNLINGYDEIRQVILNLTLSYIKNLSKNKNIRIILKKQIDYKRCHTDQCEFIKVQ